MSLTKISVAFCKVIVYNKDSSKKGHQKTSGEVVNMKFYRMEKTYINFYWRAHARYKRTKKLNYLFNMMHEAGCYREEITSLYFCNKMTDEEYSQKYEFLGLMERKVEDLLHEVQCHINEMELEIIYNS